MATMTMDAGEGGPARERTQPVEDAAEREASRLAMHGSPLERARMAYRATRALIADPDDTRQVFYIGLLVNRRSYPSFLARFTLDDEGARLLRERPAIDSTHVDFDALRALPETTLGGAYVRYLDANGLDPDLFQPPPGLPEIPAYIGQRMRQVHDLWHVLTGYRTDVAGEVALQAFTYGQTGMTSSAVVALAASARFALTSPHLVRMALEGYRRGGKARFLASIRIEDHFARDLEELRAEWGIEVEQG
ncbi:MAG: ubiquinone biosynthesis protein COQ4 [Myxococcota bacterium]|nr:ubiquinone biosynthesis protein COQ4 [Myxococcota bacterium]